MKAGDQPERGAPRTWVDSVELIEAFKDLPAIDAEQFRNDVDAVFESAVDRHPDEPR